MKKKYGLMVYLPCIDFYRIMSYLYLSNMKSTGLIRKKTGFFMVSLVFISAISGQMIINSPNWLEVYCGALYGRLIGDTVYFVTSEEHARNYLIDLRATYRGTRVELVESEKIPFIFGYGDMIREKGYVVNEIILNGDLACIQISEKLPDIKQFILVSGDFGYDAISAFPYAVLTKTIVIPVTDENQQAVYSFLKKRKPTKLLIFGQISDTIVNKFMDFEFDRIDEGNRFENNIQMVKMFMQIHPTQQVFLSNGETLEEDLFNGNFPILFITEGFIPPSVVEFIRKNVKVGVGIGLRLGNSVSKIKELTGIKVFMKIGTASRAGRVTTGLKTIEIPSIVPEIILEDLKFNLETGEISVILRNKGNIDAYAKISLSIRTKDGERIATTGNREAIKVSKGTTETLKFRVDTGGRNNIVIEATLSYGSASSIFEKIATEIFDFTSKATPTASAVMTPTQYLEKPQPTEVISGKGEGYIQIPVRSIVAAVLFILLAAIGWFYFLKKKKIINNLSSQITKLDSELNMIEKNIQRLKFEMEQLDQVISILKE